MCYILGLGGCRARDDHAACRLASETCSILANQPQLEIACRVQRTRHVSGLAGSVGLGLQYVRVSRAEEMRRGVRGGRSEGRFTRGSTRPLIRQDARGERSQKTCETRNKKVALDQAQEPRGNSPMCIYAPPATRRRLWSYPPLCFSAAYAAPRPPKAKPICHNPAKCDGVHVNC